MARRRSISSRSPQPARPAVPTALGYANTIQKLARLVDAHLIKLSYSDGDVLAGPIMFDAPHLVRTVCLASCHVEAEIII